MQYSWAKVGSVQRKPYIRRQVSTIIMKELIRLTKRRTYSEAHFVPLTATLNTMQDCSFPAMRWFKANQKGKSKSPRRLSRKKSRVYFYWRLYPLAATPN